MLPPRILTQQSSPPEALRRGGGAGRGDVGLHGVPTRPRGAEGGVPAHRPGGGAAERADLPEPSQRNAEGPRGAPGAGGRRGGDGEMEGRLGRVQLLR